MLSLNYKYLFLTLIFLGLDAKAGDWSAHVAEASTMTNQLMGLENQIRELSKEKSHTKDPARIQTILQEMQKKHGEIKTKYPDYEKLRRHMQFQHPERGDNSERKYLLFQLKSIEEIEAEVGLDGQLDRLKRKTKTIYQADLPPPPEPEPSPIPHDPNQGRPVLRK